MAFKQKTKITQVPSSPDKLLLHLPRRKIPDVLPHQREVMRTYAAKGIDSPDVAIQMANGKKKRKPKSAQRPANRKKNHMRETSYETGSDDMQRLRALVPFLSKFEAPGFKFGHVCSFFDADLSPVVLDFVSTCYKLTRPKFLYQ